ncbi:hypothetical protein NSZ01_28280 [Nocardioides szechwanensis]|nr:hypothetical protein NSZ01_28280 [Nocardioides szechwanensis]
MTRPMTGSHGIPCCAAPVRKPSETDAATTNSATFTVPTTFARLVSGDGHQARRDDGTPAPAAGGVHKATEETDGGQSARGVAGLWCRDQPDPEAEAGKDHQTEEDQQP